jgi:hypothetical protein
MKSFKIYTLHEAAKKSARERARAAGLLFVTKDLAPSKIPSLTTDNIITGQSIYFGVKEWLLSLKEIGAEFEMTEEQIDYMLNLLESISTLKANSSTNVGKPPFEKKDVAQISKDFGEVLAGVWLGTQYPNGTGVVEFPSKNSLPIADVLCPTPEGGVDLISIKTKKGSPTSFKGIWDKAKASGFFGKYDGMLKREEEELVDIINLLIDNRLFESPIMVAKYLYDEWETNDGVGFGLPILARIMGTNIKTLTNLDAEGRPWFIEDWLVNTMKNDVKAIKTELEPFYRAIGKDVGKDEWAKYNTAKQKNKQEKIQSPLAYHLVDFLNEYYSEHLTSLLNTFRDIVQVNVDLNMSGKLSVTVNHFKTMKFIFANAGNSTAGRNKIGFKKG